MRKKLHPRDCPSATAQGALRSDESPIPSADVRAAHARSKRPLVPFRDFARAWRADRGRA